jgi:hypothetical protein
VLFRDRKKLVCGVWRLGVCHWVNLDLVIFVMLCFILPSGSGSSAFATLGFISSS